MKKNATKLLAWAMVTGLLVGAAAPTTALAAPKTAVAETTCESVDNQNVTTEESTTTTEDTTPAVEKETNGKKKTTKAEKKTKKAEKKAAKKIKKVNNCAKVMVKKKGVIFVNLKKAKKAKDATIEVVDENGNQMEAKLVNKSKTNLKIKITGMVKGQKYTVTVTGITVKKYKNVCAVTKTFTAK